MGNSFKKELTLSSIKDLSTNLDTTTNNINIELDAVFNDMQFISKSDVVNDIFTNDLDKRLSNLLLSKKNDKKIIGDFFIKNNDGIIVASSNFNLIGTKNNIDPFFSIDIISSITQQKIGVIYLNYSLSNLNKFFKTNKHEYLIYKKGDLIVNDDSYLSKNKELKYNNIVIVIKEKKDVAYYLLYKYEKILYLFLIIGGVFIGLSAYIIGLRLIKPVVDLVKTTNDIANTHNYSKRVDVLSNNEIGQLSLSINHLISGVESSMKEISSLNNEIKDTQREVIFTMGEIAESRSKETGNHVKRVSEYSKLFALKYGMDETEAELLKQASPMHDIGKVAIPDAILNKNGKLTDEERIVMNTHAELGFNMLKHSDKHLMRMASIVAKEHHEKWDGSGYPLGLKGEEINIYGRITALADVFDALGSDRCYKKAWDDKRIFSLFKDEKGKHFDPYLVDIFFDNLDEFLKIRDSFKD
jgi:response regulator RpfG family c-di-GMP phosphodiesterase